jgi:hypothetical protein
MTESSASQDPFLGNTPLVSFKDVFNIQARDNATMYFAMRYCKAGIPAPMRFEVTVTPQPFPNITKEGISLPPLPLPWAGVCLASALQENKQGSNQALKSVKCESDVGERGLEALVIDARVMCMLICIAGQSCLLQGNRPLHSLEDSTAFKGNKVSAIWRPACTEAAAPACALFLIFCSGCGAAFGAIRVWIRMRLRIFPLEIQWQVVNQVPGFHSCSVRRAKRCGLH